MRIDTHDKSVEEKGARESLVSSTVQKSRKKGHLLRMQDRDLGSGFRGGYKLRNLSGAGTLPRLPDPGTHPSQQCGAHGCSERCPGWRKLLPPLLPSALALDSLSRATLADHLPSATSCATRGGARRAGHATRAPDSPRHVRLWKSALRHPGRVRRIARPRCSRGLGRVNSP